MTTCSITPSSATIAHGTSQTFTATASGGTSPYTYQWYLSGNAMSGETGSTYTYNASDYLIGTQIALSIYCIATDSLSSSGTSNTATLTVLGTVLFYFAEGSTTNDLGFAIGFSDAVSLAEELAKSSKLTLSEAISIVEFLSKHTELLFAIAISFSESFSKHSKFPKTDIVDMVETISKHLSGRVYSDAINSNDALIRKTLSDLEEILTITDLSFVKSIHIDIPEALLMIENMNKIYHTEKSEASIALNDLLSRITAITLLESLSAIEKISKDTIHSFISSMSFSDVLQRHVSRIRTKTDAVSMTESEFARKMGIEFYDSAILSDSLNEILAKVMIDTATFSEQFSKETILKFSEALSSYEEFLKVPILKFAEALTIYDSVNKITTSHRIDDLYIQDETSIIFKFFMHFSESLFLDEAFSKETYIEKIEGISYVETILKSLNLIDNLYSSETFLKEVIIPIIDNMTIDDSIKKHIRFYLMDLENTSETFEPLVITKRITDYLNTIESVVRNIFREYKEQILSMIESFNAANKNLRIFSDQVKFAEKIFKNIYINKLENLSIYDLFNKTMHLVDTVALTDELFKTTISPLLDQMFTEEFLYRSITATLKETIQASEQTERNISLGLSDSAILNDEINPTTIKKIEEVLVIADIINKHIVEVLETNVNLSEETQKKVTKYKTDIATLHELFGRLQTRTLSDELYATDAGKTISVLKNLASALSLDESFYIGTNFDDVLEYFINSLGFTDVVLLQDVKSVDYYREEPIIIVPLQVETVTQFNGYNYIYQLQLIIASRIQSTFRTYLEQVQKAITSKSFSSNIYIMKILDEQFDQSVKGLYREFITLEVRLFEKKG